MWAGGGALDDLLTGDHEVSVTADAWYLGEAVWPDLRVTAATTVSEFDGSTVRTTAELAVDDAEGALVPTMPTDPLAGFGQSVTVAVDVSAGRVSERVPVGEFRVEPVTADGGWRPVTKRGTLFWLATGGTIQVPLVDNIARVVDAELRGLMVPRGPTNRAELDRLITGLPGVRADWSGLPSASVTAGGAAYGESRLDAVVSYVRDRGRVLGTDRDGMLVVLNPNLKTVPDLVVTTDTPRWVDTTITPSRDGIYNQVETTGQETEDGKPPPTGFTQVLDGPYGVRTLGPRLLRQHSEFFRNRTQAQMGAQTRLRTSISARRVRFQVTQILDPRVECLDTHRVAIRPRTGGDVTVLALVVGVSIDWMQAEMTVTYEVPREVLEQ